MFGNVNKVLKQKQSCLQQLEELNLLHESAEEVQSLKKEINEVRLKEEIMGPFGLSLFLLKRKTETENTVAK